MITLNFISPIQREANRFQKNYSQTKGIMLSLVIVLIIIVGFLQLTQILLKDKLESITLATQVLEQAEEEKTVDLKQIVKDFNVLLRNIDGIQKEYLPWSDTLALTASLVPTGIELSSFSIQKESAVFKLTGHALSRDDLIILQKNLEESDLFSEIQSPLSNLLLKENINFELSGKITLVPSS